MKKLSFTKSKLFLTCSYYLSNLHCMIWNSSAMTYVATAGASQIDIFKILMANIHNLHHLPRQGKRKKNKTHQQHTTHKFSDHTRDLPKLCSIALKTLIFVITQLVGTHQKCLRAISDYNSMKALQIENSRIAKK